MREAHRRGLRVITELVDQPHVSDQHPWFVESRSSPQQPEARLVRVERHGPEVRRRADHLHRYRDLELDLGPGVAAVLLASVLQPPAGPQLRQPAGHPRDPAGDALLARPRRRRAAARRGARTSSSARARTARTCPRRTPSCVACAQRSTSATTAACCWPRRTSGRRTCCRTSARPTTPECHMAFHFPLMPRIWIALRREDRYPIVEIMSQTPEIPEREPVGALPAQPRRADARDGDRRGARLHVHRVRVATRGCGSTSASVAGWRRSSTAAVAGSSC